MEAEKTTTPGETGRQREFDYIIVGAGSAGCVLAARLSQDPNIRVALVEAGGPDDAPEINMPVAFPQLFKTKYDWDFATEPEPALAGATDLSASRQNTGRQFRDKRHDLHPRKRSRFRWLGGRGRTGVVVPGDAALLHQVRVQ